MKASNWAMALSMSRTDVSTFAGVLVLSRLKPAIALAFKLCLMNRILSRNGVKVGSNRASAFFHGCEAVFACWIFAVLFHLSYFSPSQPTKWNYFLSLSEKDAFVWVD